MLILLLAAMAVNAQGRKISYSVEKIWGDGQHCAFREGESHIFAKNGNAEGKIRVLVSGISNSRNFPTNLPSAS